MDYNGDLKSGLVWIFYGQKEIALQKVWILNGIWNPEAQPLKSGQLAAVLSKTIWNQDKNLPILNVPVFEWLGL